MQGSVKSYGWIKSRQLRLNQCTVIQKGAVGHRQKVTQNDGDDFLSILFYYVHTVKEGISLCLRNTTVFLDSKLTYG